MAEKIKPQLSSSTAPRKKPCRLRLKSPAPLFWAMKMAVASQPLMPKAWMKFYTRVTAVKAEMDAVPRPLTAPWIISLPK